MKHHKTSLLILFITFIYSNTSYSSSLTSEKLINSCKEAVAIYSNKSKELKSYAAITTSLSEAFEGGYCSGAIQTYLATQNYYCRSANWYESAVHVASLAPKEYSSASKVLKEICN